VDLRSRAGSPPQGAATTGRSPPARQIPLQAAQREPGGPPRPRPAWSLGAAGCAGPSPDGTDVGLLLEGIALRLQADLLWLEACERNWTHRRRR
jgi:hypothetical protein